MDTFHAMFWFDFFIFGCAYFALCNGFIQAVLLMSVFERRLSFQMFYFVKNNHMIILKWSWGPGCTVSFTGGALVLQGLWWSTSTDHVVKHLVFLHLVNNSWKNKQANLYWMPAQSQFLLTSFKIKLSFKTQLEDWIFVPPTGHANWWYKSLHQYCYCSVKIFISAVFWKSHF